MFNWEVYNMIQRIVTVIGIVVVITIPLQIFLFSIRLISSSRRAERENLETQRSMDRSLNNFISQFMMMNMRSGNGINMGQKSNGFSTHSNHADYESWDDEVPLPLMADVAETKKPSALQVVLKMLKVTLMIMGALFLIVMFLF